MLTIDVISDVICPWCFIGKRRQERALAGRPATVRWHPFQLNPDMPREGIDRKEYRIQKFGSWERSLELDARVAAAGRGEGIVFNFDKMARTPNTLDSHRIIWLAGERGVAFAELLGALVARARDGGARAVHWESDGRAEEVDEVGCAAQAGERRAAARHQRSHDRRGDCRGAAAGRGAAGEGLMRG